ncbi:hypothetical protein ACWF82_15630 [Nocardia sp. NPDC055053]
MWTDYTSDDELSTGKFAVKPVQLPAAALEILAARVHHIKTVRLALPPKPDDADWPDDLLFFDLDDGGPRNLKSMSRRWRRLAAALGLPDGVTPYSLRKHVGTEVVAAGLDATKVADQLGNTDRVLRNAYVRRHQPHADVTALIGNRLGPALEEVARRRAS